MLRSNRPDERARNGSRLPGLGDRVRECLEAADIPQACRLIEAAIRQRPTSTVLRYQLGVLRQARGDRAGAAVEYARVLRLEATHRDAAHRLGEVLSQGRLPPGILLDASGLANCLSHRTIDRDLVAAAALHQLRQNGPLSQALARCRTQDVKTLAGEIAARRASDLIRDELLLAILHTSIIADREVEALLTALRRSLVVDLARGRLGERDLLRFTIAMSELGAGNEYVFATTAEERARLDTEPVRVAPLLAGDREAGMNLLIHSLYRDPLHLLPADLPVDATDDILPAEFGKALKVRLVERRQIETHARNLPRHGTISSETSLRVASQYQRHPYPRWRGVPLFKAQKYVEYLQTFFTAPRLSFARRPFEILIAGCGTGSQAVSAALDYGINANVTAIDISAPSLGYAAMMAERFEAPNVSFALADIGEVGTFDPAWTGRFQVIECSGVLHHMNRPFEAWAGLLDCLSAGGIMLVGLYSACARRELDVLRAEPEFPGAGCDDDQLRTYRQVLLSREPGQPGAGFLRSRDAFTTSGFRDFFLHVSEQTTTIPIIANFLETNDLVFKGFVNVPFEALAQRFPGEVWPGRLERWADLEAEKPSLFIGMYQFWITRR